MEKTKELMKKIDNLILKSKDEDLIKELGGLKTELTALEQDINVLEDKHVKAVELYAEAIANAGTKEEPESVEEETPLTFEDILNSEQEKK